MLNLNVHYSPLTAHRLSTFSRGHPHRNGYVSGSVLSESLTPGVLCGTLDRKPTSGTGQSLFVVCFELNISKWKRTAENGTGVVEINEERLLVIVTKTKAKRSKSYGRVCMCLSTFWTRNTVAGG